MRELNSLIIEGTLTDYNIASGWGHIRNNDDLITVYFKFKRDIINLTMDTTNIPVRIVGSIKQGNNLYPYILVEHLEAKRYLHHTSVMTTE